MSSPPVIDQSSRTSTGAISDQSTLVPGFSRQTTATSNAPRPQHDAFRKALSAFGSRLSAEEKTSFENTTYETIVREMLILQREQERRKEMMNLSRLQAFLEGMQQLSKIIEVYLNVHQIVAFIWGPIKFLLLTASTFAESFETLLDAYEQIGETLPLLSEHEDLFHDNPHMTEALMWIYMDVLEFHKRAIRFFQGKKWTRIFKSMWRDFDTQFGGTLRSLKRHKDLVECRASLSQYRRYQEDMVTLKSEINELVGNERRKKLTNVKEWLATEQGASADQERFREIRGKYSMTTKWIFDRDDMKDWLNVSKIPSTPLLWMCGIPGAGKTILASAVTDECKQSCEFTTCYFYCHEGDQNSNSAIAILKGLVEQLLDHYPDLLPPCYTRRTLSGEPTLRSLHQARKLFEDCCFTVPKLFLIIDGLDECELVERRQIIEIIMDIVSQCDVEEQGKLRVMFVSQDYADIRKALHSSGASRMTPRTLHLHEADVAKDISAYVRIWVDKISTKFTSTERPFTDDMKEYLRNLTVANAKGMFLYAKLVMENLLSQPTLSSFVEAVRKENFPAGLKEAYERILQRIKSTASQEEWAQAKRLLGWMVCAKRQLTWKEMQVALSIDLDAQEIEYDDHRLRRHIHDICGSLVLLSGDRVTLVHSTAKTFITNTSEGIHEPSIECELAVLCLSYLTFPCFEPDEQSDEQLQDMMLRGHFAFQDYAVAKWFYHVNALVNSGQKFLSEAVDTETYLEKLATAIEDFMMRYEEEDWPAGLVEDCRSSCEAFEDEPLYDNLVLLTSHIYTFQQKGFEARHKISIKSLEAALERNRKLLETFPSAKTTNKSDLARYQTFYSEKRIYKCNKITCRYFSEGFTDVKSRKKHVNIHDRPFQCEVSGCIGEEGFANHRDREKHIRSFHPEMSDLAEAFNTATAKRTKATHACTICGKTFTRNFHRKHHEDSHRGIRPYECPECGKAFTRHNDMRRHTKLHERGR